MEKYLSDFSRLMMTKLTLLFFLFLSVAGAAQYLELAAPFTDNMILQRESKVPVWGFDQPGSRVIVEFAGQTKSAVADKHGDWMLKLDPLKISFDELNF